MATAVSKYEIEAPGKSASKYEIEAPPTPAVTKFEDDRNSSKQPGFWSSVGDTLKSYIPSAPNPYPGMDTEAKSRSSAEAGQEARDNRLHRVEQGRSGAYRAIAPVGEALGVNVRGMEDDADVGNVKGILGKAAVPIAAAAAPLAAEGLKRTKAAIPGIKERVAVAARDENNKLKPGVETAGRLATMGAGALAEHAFGVHGYTELPGYLLGKSLTEAVIPDRPLKPPPELGSAENPGPHSKVPTTMPKKKPVVIPPEFGSPENPGPHSKIPTTMPKQKPVVAELGSPENPGFHSKIPTRMPKAGAVEAPIDTPVDRLQPVGMHGPSADEFYAHRGEDLMRRGDEVDKAQKQQAVADRSTEVPEPKGKTIRLPVPNEGARLRPLTPESVPGSDLLNIARQGHPKGGPELERRGRNVFYIPEDRPGPSARLARAGASDAEAVQPIAKPVAKNGSGESAASKEAINRVAANKSNGTQRFKVTGTGREIPLHGVDAVDVHAGAAEHIVEKGPNGTQIVESGAKAKPYTPKAESAPSYTGEERRTSSAYERDIFHKMLNNPEGEQLGRSIREARAGSSGAESEGPARQAIMRGPDYPKFRTAELNGDQATMREMLINAKKSLAASNKPPKPAGK